MTEFFDTHAHLDFPDYAEDLEAVVARATAAGITRIVTIGTTLEGSSRAVAIAERFPSVFAAVGVHPGHVDESPDEIRPALRELARHPKVVVIGETGLDYYRQSGDLTWQHERFRRHIRAGIAAGKPLIIHTRSAAEDTLRIMREEGAEQVGGVMHCFTESQDVAQASVEMGFMISFSGIVTFRNAEPLRQVAKWVPADSLLVETDAPYLAPVPFRGKRCEPAMVAHTAKVLAGVRGLEIAALEALTTRNFETLFQKAA